MLREAERDLIPRALALLGLVAATCSEWNMPASEESQPVIDAGPRDAGPTERAADSPVVALTVVVRPHSPTTVAVAQRCARRPKMSPNDSVIFAQVPDRSKLPTIHPARDRQQESIAPSDFASQ